MTHLCVFLAAVGLCGLAPETPESSVASPLQKLLAKPLIDPELSTRQVQAFLKPRIASVPQISSADEWQVYAEKLRNQILDEIVFKGEAAKWRQAETKVEWLGTIAGGPGYSIRKLRYEVIPGLWVPALLYRPDKMPEKTPVVMNVNGHDADGKQAPYKQIRCINQAKRGMLALNVEWFNMGQLRGDNFNHYRLNQIDLCGSSGLAPFVLSMMRGLDILLSLPNADPDRVAVAGLSGGGWQTIVISALDPRVTLADPVAGYSSFQSRAIYGEDLGDSEQTPSDLAALADYAHLTTLRAPRPTLLTFNFADNCCFKAETALPPLLEAARPVYRLLGKENNLRWHVNYDPGDHNFQQDNRVALYYMFRDFFYPDDPSFHPEEIPSEKEVKSKEELDVDLPMQNLDFHQIAARLSRDLPRDAELPKDKQSLGSWQAEKRDQLKRLVRFHELPVKAQTIGEESVDLGSLRFLRLHLGEDWTIPAVELTPAAAKGTTILIGDQGRAALAGECERLLKQGQRVLAIDPYNFGESRIQSRHFLYDLTVASVGERPLGLQVSQLAGVAKWLAGDRKAGPVSLVTVGPRSGVFGLIATAVTPEIHSLQCQEALGSMKEVIERNWSVTECAELFCFGLLEQFDIVQITTLALPRKVAFTAPSSRCQSELGSLATMYQLFGVTHDPVAE